MAIELLIPISIDFRHTKLATTHMLYYLLKDPYSKSRLINDNFIENIQSNTCNSKAIYSAEEAETGNRTAADDLIRAGKQSSSHAIKMQHRTPKPSWPDTGTQLGKF